MSSARRLESKDMSSATMSAARRRKAAMFNQITVDELGRPYVMKPDQTLHPHLGLQPPTPQHAAPQQQQQPQHFEIGVSSPHGSMMKAGGRGASPSPTSALLSPRPSTTGSGSGSVRSGSMPTVGGANVGNIDSHGKRLNAVQITARQVALLRSPYVTRSNTLLGSSLAALKRAVHRGAKQRRKVKSELHQQHHDAKELQQQQQADQKLEQVPHYMRDTAGTINMAREDGETPTPPQTAAQVYQLQQEAHYRGYKGQPPDAGATPAFRSAFFDSGPPRSELAVVMIGRQWMKNR
jgi:hypothetical protein